MNYNSQGKYGKTLDVGNIAMVMLLPGITNEYADNVGPTQPNRGSRKNIQLGKQTERAVSLVTQHRLNQTQGSN